MRVTKAVRMLKRHEQFHAGEVATFGEALADRLVAQGFAEQLPATTVTSPPDPAAPRQKQIPKITKGKA